MSQFESGWVVSAVNDMSGKGQGPVGNGWKIKKEQYYSFFKHIGEFLIVQELTTQLKQFEQEGFVGWLLKVICIFDRRHHLTVKSPLICKQPRVCLDRRDFEGKPSSPVLQKSITLSLVSNNPFKINQICEPASQLHDATVSSRDFSRKCLNLEEKQNIKNKRSLVALQVRLLGTDP